MGDVDLSNYLMNMTTNTQVPFEMMTYSIPFLKKSSSSSNIVNISSVNGKQAFMGCVSYCMSKAALDQLTRCASVDLAKFGIRVNAINPGVIETNLQKVSRSLRITSSRIHRIHLRLFSIHCLQYIVNSKALLILYEVWRTIGRTIRVILEAQQRAYPSTFQKFRSRRTT